MEQEETLKKAVKQSDVRSARVITVTSGKGGVGKSTTSVNLAIQFARMNKKVIILDADFGLANIEVMLGIRPKYSLADLMFRGKTLTEIITYGPENIGFISGGSGIQELTNLSKEQIGILTEGLAELDALADIIIVDTGAGISEAILEFVGASSEILLIATPEPTSITDAYALLKAINKKEDFSSLEHKIWMISNRVSTPKEGQDIYDKLNMVVERFLDIKLHYLGGVIQDPYVSRSIMKQTPISILYPDMKAAKGLKELAQKLTCEEEKETERLGGVAGLFGKLIKNRLKQKKNN
ncbi:MAG: MinD/ParA family protein [Lachnospiraceae bacterium]|nr:MinD/ParA family protein [Lachnospiraceae bacterium]